jgi:hypothetical protein
LLSAARRCSMPFARPRTSSPGPSRRTGHRPRPRAGRSPRVDSPRRVGATWLELGDGRMAARQRPISLRVMFQHQSGREDSARPGSSRWQKRMPRTTSGWSMAAKIRMRPPRRSHRRASAANRRRNSQLRDPRRRGGHPPARGRRRHQCRGPARWKSDYRRGLTGRCSGRHSRAPAEARPLRSRDGNPPRRASSGLAPRCARE